MREDKKPIRDAPVVQAKRTATASAARIAVPASCAPSAVPPKSAASSCVIAVIMPMLASRLTHCSATLSAIYFLLSGTKSIRRLFIIIRSFTPLLVRDI